MIPANGVFVLVIMTGAKRLTRRLRATDDRLNSGPQLDGIETHMDGTNMVRAR